MSGMSESPVSEPFGMAPVPLPLSAKVGLLLRTWFTAARVWLLLRRRPVAVVADTLGGLSTRPRQPIRLLNRAVDRSLRIGTHQPRCLIRSLVLYSLLRSQGDEAELVIGMPEVATSSDAHSWVELDGRDVGPLPGSRGYAELARYPRHDS